MLVEPIVSPHPSGVGFYLNLTPGLPFKVFRSDVRRGVNGETGLIAEGVSNHTGRYLDWSVPINRAVTYRVEVLGREPQEFTVEPRPRVHYSAIGDAANMDAANPRDALIVYYGTRLAQLVRAGKLYVLPVGDQEESNHATRYPVRTASEFEIAELPLLALEYSAGGAVGGDLGHTFTESAFEVSGVLTARSKDERDSARVAILGLWKAVEWYLEDLGCYDLELGGLYDEMHDSSPHLYMLHFTIRGVHATTQGFEAETWEMLPLVSWFARDAQG